MSTATSEPTDCKALVAVEVASAAVLRPAAAIRSTAGPTCRPRQHFTRCVTSAERGSRTTTNANRRPGTTAFRGTVSRPTRAITPCRRRHNGPVRPRTSRPRPEATTASTRTRCTPSARRTSIVECSNRGNGSCPTPSTSTTHKNIRGRTSFTFEQNKRERATWMCAAGSPCHRRARASSPQRRVTSGPPRVPPAPHPTTSSRAAAHTTSTTLRFRPPGTRYS
mmetsp:Transcript_592/g.1744  ORF Transcript_592/g.1744 Transcript_592/m.1744 type:complete len:223 (-) Transcript_592:237-905(-)